MNPRNLDALLGYVQTQEEELNEIGEITDSETDEEEDNGVVWDLLKWRRSFRETTNFTEDEVLDLVRASQPWVHHYRRRALTPTSFFKA